jgi:hypothetical protein
MQSNGPIKKRVGRRPKDPIKLAEYMEHQRAVEQARRSRSGAWATAPRGQQAEKELRFKQREDNPDQQQQQAPEQLAKSLYDEAVRQAQRKQQQTLPGLFPRAPLPKQREEQQQPPSLLFSQQAAAAKHVQPQQLTSFKPAPLGVSGRCWRKLVPSHTHSATG